MPGVRKKESVWVYLYQYWDETSHSHRISSLYATQELIRNGLGSVIHPSGIQIDRDLLKDGGIYIPPEDSPNLDG